MTTIFSTFFRTSWFGPGCGLWGAVSLAAFLWSAQVSARCECYCVDGVLRTLCSRVDEAQLGGSQCLDRAVELCPVSDEFESQVYDAPDEAAENCRAARVWDASVAEFETRKICDVKPSG